MVLKKDTVIRKKFKGGYNYANGKKILFDEGFARTLPVKWCVLHSTAGSGTLNWCRNCSKSSYRGRRYTQGVGLFHDLIEPDGIIWNILDHNRWVFHASIGGLDHGTLGIELQNHDRQNAAPLQEAQYLALAEYYTYIRDKESYEQMTVCIGHGRAKQKCYGGWKECPGKGFNWNDFRDTMSDEGWKFKFHRRVESIWDIERK